MSLVVVVLAAAVLLGWASGGSLDRLGRLPLRGLPLVVLALLAQAAGGVAGGAAYPVGLAAGALLAAAFLLLNRGTRGTGLVGLGLAANALVVAANGAMPVRFEAAVRAGVTVQPVLLGEDPRHELEDDGTRLRVLGDVVPLPLPVAPQVVSPGDVLVAAGLGQLVLLGMRRGRRLPARPALQGRGTGRPRPDRVDAGRDWLRGGAPDG